MNTKWFWGALAFWVIFGTAIGVSALILSPFDPSFEDVCSFDTKWNDQIVHHEVSMAKLTLSQNRSTTNSELKKDGWENIQAPTSWVSLLLGFDSDLRFLSPYLDVSIFRKSDRIKAVGFWKGAENSYRWSAVLKGQKAEPLNGGFKKIPFDPPIGSSGIFYGEFGGFNLLSWKIPMGIFSDSSFKVLCESQGFSCSFSPGNKRTAFLRKGGISLLAFFDQKDGAEIISIACLPLGISQRDTRGRN